MEVVGPGDGVPVWTGGVGGSPGAGGVAAGGVAAGVLLGSLGVAGVVVGVVFASLGEGPVGGDPGPVSLGGDRSAPA